MTTYLSRNQRETVFTSEMFKSSVSSRMDSRIRSSGHNMGTLQGCSLWQNVASAKNIYDSFRVVHIRLTCVNLRERERDLVLDNGQKCRPHLLLCELQEWNASEACSSKWNCAGDMYFQGGWQVFQTTDKLRRLSVSQMLNSNIFDLTEAW